MHEIADFYRATYGDSPIVAAQQIILRLVVLIVGTMYMYMVTVKNSNH